MLTGKILRAPLSHFSCRSRLAGFDIDSFAFSSCICRRWSRSLAVGDTGRDPVFQQKPQLTCLNKSLNLTEVNAIPVSLRFLLSLALILIGVFTPTFRCAGSFAAQATNVSPEIQQRVKTYETSCVSSLRTINVAQGAYWGGDPNKGFARRLKQLGPEGEDLLSAGIPSGSKEGYRFLLLPEHAAKNKPIKHYIVSARPIKYLIKGQRSFITDETGVIRSTTERRAARVTDPPNN